MPKLTVPQRTYGRAVEYLIKHYKQESGFVKELKKLRQKYELSMIHWLDLSIPQWQQMNSIHSRLKKNTDGSVLLSKEAVEAINKISYGTKDLYQGLNVGEELIKYEKELRDLAYKWHLKAQWSGVVFIYDHLLDIVGITLEDIWKAEANIEMLDPLLGKASLPPFKFTVEAYELMYSDQQEIKSKFLKGLSEYSKKVKSQPNWSELPSAIKKHADWWFEHYVHGKKYWELENPQVGWESIKRAVWNFSKLLSIKIK